MPLKLLGKKSWNVYNAANIERVRRDEAEAAAREAAAERQRKEAESARNQAILRGEDPGPEVLPEVLPEVRPESATTGHKSSSDHGARSHSFAKKRKRHGENDTDFEMRLARERIENDGSDARGAEQRHMKKRADVAARPLVDADGHIDLFGGEEERGRQKRQERERIEAPVSSADNMTNMRFVDAAGRHGSFGTWYAGGDADKGRTSAQRGQGESQDGARKRRRPPLQTSASALADPLAAMKQGAAAVRVLTQERRREAEERARDMAAMAAMAADEAADKGHGQEERRHRHSRRDRRDHHDHHHHSHHHHHDDDHSHRHRDHSRHSSRHRHRDREREDGHRKREAQTST